MTGIPQFNIPAFDAVAADLRTRGYDVVSPAELDDPETRKAALASSDGAPGSGTTNGETWGDFLARDIKLIADGGIEAIVCLPGWEESKGARLETFVGRLCGLLIVEYSAHEACLRGVYAHAVSDAHAWRDGEGYGGYDFYGDVWDVESRWPLKDECSACPAAADDDVCLPGVGDGPSPTSHVEYLFPKSAGEIRVTDPETGGQKGMKLAQLGALDPLALLEVAKVAGFGSQKYERFNFARGYAWSLSFDALQRHLLLWAAGVGGDEESGLPHLAHAAWHCLALLTFTLRMRGTDDRLHTTLEAM